jgi:hypothetical protein
MAKERFETIEICLRDDEGNIVHAVPLKTGFDKEATKEAEVIHNMDLSEHLTHALVQELTFKYAEDDRTQLQEAIKEIVNVSMHKTK